MLESTQDKPNFRSFQKEDVHEGTDDSQRQQPPSIKL